MTRHRQRDINKLSTTDRKQGHLLKKYQMKIVERKIFVFILTSLLLYSCNNGKKNSAPVSHPANGYCIHRLKTADWDKGDYYIFTKGKDTINMTLSVVTRYDKSIGLIIREGINFQKYTKTTVPLAEQMKLLGMFIKEHCKGEKVKQIGDVDISFVLDADVNAEITTEDLNTRGRKTNAIVYNSRMRQALDSVFSPYNMYVKKVTVGKVGDVNKSIVKELHTYTSNYASLPKTLLQGPVCFSIAERKRGN